MSKLVVAFSPGSLDPARPSSWHVQLGTPLYALKELGGRETLEMVNRYAHLAPEHLKAHADRLSISSGLTAQIRHSEDLLKNPEIAVTT